MPSCELGVPRASVRDPYVAYFARGRVCELARAVGASHFVEARGKYLDPTDIACLRALLAPPGVEIGAQAARIRRLALSAHGAGDAAPLPVA